MILRARNLLIFILMMLTAFEVLESRAAFAAQQDIELKVGWNLIAFAVVPADPAVAAVFGSLGAGNLKSVWSYDALTSAWSVYRPAGAIVGVTALASVETGRGYWLELQGGQQTLTVTGSATALATLPQNLIAGWQLIGFPADEPQQYQQVFGGLPVREIWTYDSASGKFLAVDLPNGTAGLPLREDFKELQLDRGYWVRMAEAGTFQAILDTVLPPDIDAPPILPAFGPAIAKPGDPLPPTVSPDLAIAWLPVVTGGDPGDVDVGDFDGFFDRPTTQRDIDFESDLSEVTLRIVNQPLGFTDPPRGVLNWRAEITTAVPPSCLGGQPIPAANLFFRRIDPITRKPVSFRVLSGSLASQTAALKVRLSRAGLDAGRYCATIELQTNAVMAPDVGVRRFEVFAMVPEIDGDYVIDAAVTTIDGKPLDTVPQRIIASIFRDQDGRGIKAIVDPNQTLIFPTDMHLVGSQYRAGSFVLSGSFEIPTTDPSNSFGVPIRRELRLTGHRAASDSGLGPLDFAGDYDETIQNLLPFPVHMKGTFVARRVDGTPSIRDGIDVSNEKSGNIPDPGPLEKTFVVTKNVLITEVDVNIRLTHPRPQDLTLTLFGPDETDVVLREGNPSDVSVLNYDSSASPVESLDDAFVGKLSKGTWRLKIEDVMSGERGNFSGADLQIRGTDVFVVRGTIPSVGIGATVILSGCGILRQMTTTDPSGTFEFKDLIECRYSITVFKNGHLRTQFDAPVTDKDLVLNLTPGIAPTPTPGALPTPTPIVPMLPSDATYRFTALTTSAGAGALSKVQALAVTGNGARERSQYGFDSATHDLDREPTGSPYPGTEDSDAFGLDAGKPYDCTRWSNSLEPDNGVFNSFVTPNPACEPAGVPANVPYNRRVTIGIGFPVAGPEVENAGIRLRVGANPAVVPTPVVP